MSCDTTPGNSMHAQATFKHHEHTSEACVVWYHPSDLGSIDALQCGIESGHTLQLCQGPLIKGVAWQATGPASTRPCSAAIRTVWPCFVSSWAGRACTLMALAWGRTGIWSTRGHVQLHATELTGLDAWIVASQHGHPCLLWFQRVRLGSGGLGHDGRSRADLPKVR